MSYVGYGEDNIHSDNGVVGRRHGVLCINFEEQTVLFSRLVDYLLWVFYSAFFVRYILDALEQEKPLKEVLIAILLIGGGSLLLEMFLFYCQDVWFPAWNVTIFHSLYKKIYKNLTYLHNYF